MRPEPELLVPISEAREVPVAPAPAPRHSRAVVILARLWIVLALLAGGFVLASNAGFKAAALTVGGFAIVWSVVAWIFGE